MTGVGPQHTSATKIWFGKASNPPGFRSLPHHHGEAETGAYVLSGRARVYFGKDFQEYIDLSEGDFMFVPPLISHLEVNMSTTEELWWLACRTPENIVVNLPDVERLLARRISPSLMLDMEPDDWCGRDEPIGTILLSGKAKGPGFCPGPSHSHVA